MIGFSRIMMYMNIATRTKALLLFVSIVAIFSLLILQKHSLSFSDIAILENQETFEDLHREVARKNIMPNEMLADIQQRKFAELKSQTFQSSEQLPFIEDKSLHTNNKEELKKTVLFMPSHIKIADACGPYFEGECLNVRRQPSTKSDIVTQLRSGQVFKVSEIIESEERLWYKIMFDEWIRYPERLKGDWYVAADFVHPIELNLLTEPSATTSAGVKRIVVDLSDQKLTAYEGEKVFMEEDVSTGTIGAVTPRGTFAVFYRTPSRYMQGPIPGITDDAYDLPGVPWNLYFTEQGAVIHGAYWHNNFGNNWSHGCVNLPPEKAQKLFAWTPVGTEVTVQD